MSTTHITVQGWAGSDVTLTDTAGGRKVGTFRLASTPRRLDREGVWQSGETNWFTVRAWGQAAENIADSVRRSHPVVVTGRLSADTWERRDGSISTTQVIDVTALGHDVTLGVSRFRRVREEDRFDRPQAEAPSNAGGAGSTDVADVVPFTDESGEAEAA